MSVDARDPLWAHRLLINACVAHGVQFFWRGPGALLIAATGVPGVLRTVLDEEDVRLLGLEGFELDGAVIHPRLDLIFDVDRRPTDDAFAVLASWDKGVWIDVALGRRSGVASGPPG